MSSNGATRRILEVPTSFRRGRGRVQRLSFVEGPVSADGRHVMTGRVKWEIPNSPRDL